MDASIKYRNALTQITDEITREELAMRVGAAHLNGGRIHYATDRIIHVFDREGEVIGVAELPVS